MHNRTQYQKIWQEFAGEKSMVFISGPRQAGKTTLARLISRSFVNSLYFNWDIARDRALFVENPTFFESIDRRDTSIPLVILDEIHKHGNWKNYLKGVYDQFHGDYQFLVTGSGRLDLYRKGGDSLAGRYLLFHLWPFTLAELAGRNIAADTFWRNPLQISMEHSGELRDIWLGLSELGGFPEPFLSGRKATYRRWSNTYSRQLIREDIRDLTGIKAIGDIETLYFLLPSKIGSPLSAGSLANDLRVSYNTVRSWLDVFQRFFLVFSISPWTGKIARAIQKERKVYLWDAPLIKDAGARFENMVACDLWRAVTLWSDMGYGTFDLHFVKNKEQQEVDFLISRDRAPFLLIETKLSDKSPSPALRKFQKMLRVPAVQLTNEGEVFQIQKNGDQSILVAPAHGWLAGLPG